ncbi:MAG: tRNA pseudouridine(54/55) synthase Pus10, partial [Nitrososphaeria archaeon]
PLPVREKEDKIRAEFGVTTGEDIKRDINREVGKRISDIAGVEAAFHNPDVTVTVDLFAQKHMVESNPLFIGGRYRKLSRNLPQSVWICPRCRGRGCDDCSGTGRKYPESISEMIGLPSVAHFKASDFKFHAAGREDVDVAMLGSGRPFVLELKSPLKRRGDFGELEKEINTEAVDRVEVLDLCYSSRREARALKARSPASTKTYLARVAFDSNLDQSKLDELEASFSNVVVEQKTPSRVLGRRSDRTRRKRLYELSAKKIDEKIAELTMKAQGGLYIKELITGDNGRTTPSICQALDSIALKIDLTVLEVDR